MPKEIIVPPSAAQSVAPYSLGTRADGVIYVSGCVAIDNNGRSVGIGDVRAQTKMVLDTIKGILEAAGGSLEDITLNTIFLKDLSDYATMNDVYRSYFPANPPARYCVRADLVRPEWLVEISSIAHVAE